VFVSEGSNKIEKMLNKEETSTVT